MKLLMWIVETCAIYFLMGIVGTKCVKMIIEWKYPPEKYNGSFFVYLIARCSEPHGVWDAMSAPYLNTSMGLKDRPIARWFFQKTFWVSEIALHMLYREFASKKKAKEEKPAKRYFTWQSGRQGTGYGKMLLAEWSNRILPFDAYLLKYPQGSEIPTHTDPVPKRRHVRINIVVKKPRKGGMFSCTDSIFASGRFNVFYSDRPHQVSRIEEGSRLVLSIGMLVGRKTEEAKQ